MKPKVKILLLVTGDTIQPIRDKFGNCPQFFFNLLDTRADLTSHYIYLDWKNGPSVEDFDGVIMTGSASMLDEDLEWMRSAKSLVKTCLANEVPFFGVCFGHQILGAVCGAKVGPNPKGRANGSTEVNVIETSKIFENAPKSFDAQISHRDVILENSDKFQVIAKTSHDERHAIKVGKSAFGVQFHPEWSMEISKGYILARKDLFREDDFQNKLASLRESPYSGQILQRFVDCCGHKSWQPK